MSLAKLHYRQHAKTSTNTSRVGGCTVSVDYYGSTDGVMRLLMTQRQYESVVQEWSTANTCCDFLEYLQTNYALVSASSDAGYVVKFTAHDEHALTLFLLKHS